MITFWLTIVKLFFNLFKSRKSLICENLMLKKELQILLRKRNIKTNTILQDRIFFTILNKIASIKDLISIVKPETVLRWQRMIIKSNLTFNTGTKRRGRKPIAKDIKYLILTIKNDNILWGVRKIKGELRKLGITIDYKTIWNILRTFRRKGKVKKYLNWKKFLKLQVNSIYAMDFFTIDTIFNKRYYVFFIISHKTREIVRFAITESPTREFVKQQFIEFEYKMNSVVYLIHDNAVQFNLDYLSYSIKGISTSIMAPNMNSISERFVKNARVEALDYFLLLNQKQIKGILTEYINYYNTMRPHQGIKQNIPHNYKPQKEGKITKLPILSGLHHHYYRKAA